MTAADPPVVLLVDDEELFRMTVVAALAARFPGIAVREAPSGAEALAVLERERVDCVVSDLAMSDGDGIELLSEMLVRRSAVPVIVVSAFAAPGLPIADGILCIPKPVELYSLCSEIDAAVRATAHRAARVTLAGLVHLIVCEQRVCALHLERGSDASADFYFEQGALVTAEVAIGGTVLSGVDGALEALGWRATRVTCERRAPRTRSSTSNPPPIHLANLFAQLDARARLRAIRGFSGDASR